MPARLPVVLKILYPEMCLMMRQKLFQIETSHRLDEDQKGMVSIHTHGGAQHRCVGADLRNGCAKTPSATDTSASFAL
jgi:hypothetical protein